MSEQETETAAEQLPPQQLTAEPTVMVDAASIWEVENIRDQMGESELDELASNIALHGLLHSLTVRPTPQDKTHGLPYELVYGYRRKAACEKLGHSQLPVVVRDLSDQQLLEEMISENLQREDLTALAEARAMKRLKDTFSLSNRQVGERLGVHRSQVGKRLALLELPEQVRGLLEDGSLTASHAEVIMRLDDAKEQQQVAELAVKSRASVDKLAGYVSGIISEQDRKHAASEDQLLPAPRIDNPAIAVSLPDFQISPMDRLQLHQQLGDSVQLRAQCYVLLASGNDIELQQWLQETHSIKRDQWWSWLDGLAKQQLKELAWTLTARWMQAAHRLSTYPQEMSGKLGEIVSEPAPSPASMLENSNEL